MEKSNILMNVCMSDMVEYSTLYLIILNKKWNHVNKKRLFSKIKQKMQKNETVRLSKLYRNTPKKFEGRRAKTPICVFFRIQDDCRRQNSSLPSALCKEHFLSYLSNIFVHFQQYFHFYASYDPNFFIDATH